MNGDEKWTEGEKHLPKIMSSNPRPDPSERLPSNIRR